jgi:hypothetical protein
VRCVCSPPVGRCTLPYGTVNVSDCDFFNLPMTVLYHYVNHCRARSRSRAEQSRAEQSRAEQSKSKSKSRAEQSRAEQSRAEQSRAEQSRAEQSRAEQSRAEQSRARVRARARARACFFYSLTCKVLRPHSLPRRSYYANTIILYETKKKTLPTSYR